MSAGEPLMNVSLTSKAKLSGHADEIIDLARISLRR
jgi:hypothetical protein